MEKVDILNAVFLCIVNILFMVAGIILNSVVIVSLWRSRQLRKQLCYFMILVLSCFDLAVVAINHPFLITSTICYFFEDINEMREGARVTVSLILCGLSISGLFMLNAERFLAITCPYFYQRSISKTKLIRFQVFTTILIVGVSSLANVNTQTVIAVNIIVAICLSFLLLLFIVSNYKIFTIAKSKRIDELAVPSFATSLHRKTRIISLKSVSTSSLAVGCFFLCSCPHIMYSVLRFTSGAPPYDRKVLLFNIWSNTFVSINSTLNCLIFFWRNSILRREGLKMLALL